MADWNASRRMRLLPGEVNTDVLLYDVTLLTDPDCGSLDALARLELAARRDGRRIRLRGASPRLRELLQLAGLSEVMALEPDP